MAGLVRLEPVEMWPGWTEPGACWCGGVGQGGGQPHAQGCTKPEDEDKGDGRVAAGVMAGAWEVGMKD